MLHNKTTYLVGTELQAPRPLPVFSAQACAFLGDLSSAIRNDARARGFADLQTFAFWCRAGNINRLAERYKGQARLGRGVALHIAPSNVPVNTAYTFAFGLLAGNANIVRVPSREMEPIDILCDIMRELLKQPQHEIIRDMTAFARYPADNAVTAELSRTCDARIIWGGDTTVNKIRSTPIPPRAVELTFADRYSFCLLAVSSVDALTDEELHKLLEGFYNDTYLMDQDACSSPQLVLWLGDHAAKAQARFWHALADLVAKKYTLQPVQAVNKYTMLLDAAIVTKPDYVHQYGGGLYVVGLDHLRTDQDAMRGKYGLFYEKHITGFDELNDIVNDKYQTLTSFGVDNQALRQHVIDKRLMGIDRIVPVGKALDIDIIWDGHDVIASLSRFIEAQ